MENNNCNGITYIVKEGDSLYQISRLYRMPLTLILKANPSVDPYNLQIGEEIYIPIECNYSSSNNLSWTPQGEIAGGESQQWIPQGKEGIAGGESQQWMPQGEIAGGESQQWIPQGEIAGGESQQWMPQGEIAGGESQQWMPQEKEEIVQVQPEAPQFPFQPNVPIAPISPEYPQPLPWPFERIIDYIVKEGESLEDILDHFDIDIEDLLNYNKLNGILLCADMILHIPTVTRKKVKIGEDRSSSI